MVARRLSQPVCIIHGDILMPLQWIPSPNGLRPLVPQCALRGWLACSRHPTATSTCTKSWRPLRSQPSDYSSLISRSDLTTDTTSVYHADAPPALVVHLGPTDHRRSVVWCVTRPLSCSHTPRLLTSYPPAGTLLAMIITWAAQGKPHYVSEDGTIPYISDIGADILKPLFIVGCSITGVGFFLSLVIERWLRHSGRYAARSVQSAFGFRRH